ncbi:MAG TPA: S41 family peptidase, partial [Caldimonas sp.]
MRHSPDMKRSRCAWAGGVAALFLLASCGGGGGGGYSAPSDPSSGLAASTTYAGLCAAPRPSDRQGTLADEKNWLRSWIDETYLWYLDVRGLSAATLDPANAATPIDYFDVLKSPLLTATGNPKDKFHFTYDTPTWVALSQSGIEFGYGFEVALLSAKPPRQAVVAYTDPGTPANPAGIVRGATFLTVDGIDFVNASSKADVDAINAGLFPKAAGTHSFTIMDLGASAPRTVTLSAAALTKTPVQNVMTLPAPNQGIGYLQFNDHVATSEAQLVAAIAQLKAAAVTDLVLDIRYNGGGYLDIASELAYMIAGP